MRVGGLMRSEMKEIARTEAALICGIPYPHKSLCFLSMVGQRPVVASKLFVSEFECGTLGFVGLALKLFGLL